METYGGGFNRANTRMQMELDGIHTPEEQPRTRRFGALRNRMSAPSNPHYHDGRTRTRDQTTPDFRRVAEERGSSRARRMVHHGDDQEMNFNFGDDSRNGSDYGAARRLPHDRANGVDHPRKYVKVPASGASINAPGLSIMNNEEKNLRQGNFMPPKEQEAFLTTIQRRSAAGAKRILGKPQQKRQSLESASAPAPKLEMGSPHLIQPSDQPQGSSGWWNTRASAESTNPKQKPRVSLGSSKSSDVLNEQEDISSIRSSPTSRSMKRKREVVPTRFSLRSSTSRSYVSSQTNYDVQSSIQTRRYSTRLAQCKTNTIGSADQPIHLDSDSEPETFENKDSTTLKQDEYESSLSNVTVANIDVSVIKSNSLFTIENCDAWIGKLFCSVDLMVQSECFWICSIRGKRNERLQFMPYITIDYKDVKEAHIYRRPEEGEQPQLDENADVAERLMAETSFMALKCTLPQRDDHKLVQRFFDPNSEDDTKQLIVVQAPNDQKDGQMFERFEDVLRGACADVQRIGSSETGKLYLCALLSHASNVPVREDTGRPKRRKEANLKGFESDEAESDCHEIQLTYPLPPCSSDIVTITRQDVSRLKPERYLNDNIIDYYFKRMMLVDFQKSPLIQKNVLFLSSHFYSRLRMGKGNTPGDRMKAGYQNVSTWLTHSDFFSRSMIFIPINKDLHWSIAVIINPKMATMDPTDENQPKSCIALLDPLGSYHSKAAIIRNLKGFLALEWEKSGRGSDNVVYEEDRVHPIYVKAPHQENSFDCGVYVLKFAEVILKSYVSLVQSDTEDGAIKKDVTDTNLELLISPSAFTAQDINETRKQILRDIEEDTTQYLAKVEEKQITK